MQRREQAMRARLRSWWQFIKTHRITIQFIAIFLAVAIAFIFASYRFGWSGTGFLNKTLWDWLQLLIVPLALAVVALVFQLANARTERQIAQQRYEQDKQIAAERYEHDQYIALDKQRDDLLQTYLDRMSELLLDKQLRTSEPDAEVRNVARVRTITVLFQLNTARIDGVFAFLREAGLISNKPNNSIVSLSNTDLDGINLRGVNLSRTDFSGTTFRRADLTRADLSETNLSGTNFLDAILREAILREANLREALLLNTNLFGAVLEKANLKEALILKANLKEAFLEEADLSGAILSADMSGARDTTPEQLAKAKSLEGATMPDGSINP
jgi:uncharacterized protein YjbI with pentapeptide repeats